MAAQDYASTQATQLYPSNLLDYPPKASEASKENCPSKAIHAPSSAPGLDARPNWYHRAGKCPCLAQPY